jgi:hypothetical protein
MIIFFILFISIYFLIDFPNFNLVDILCFINDNDINLNTNISVTKEAGKAIGQGLQIIGTKPFKIDNSKQLI